jgi:cell division protein FtsL
VAQPQLSQTHQALTDTERVIWGVRTFVFTLVFVVVLVSLGIYQVWHRYRVYSLGMELSRETLVYRSALEENRKLRLELATLKRVDHLRARAEDRLGMHVPAPQDIVEIR